MPTPTTNMGLQKPTVQGDSGAWGGYQNAAFDIIDTLALFPTSTSNTSGNLAFDNVRPIVFEQATGGSLGIVRTLPSAVGKAGKIFHVTKVDSGAGSVTVAGVINADYVLVNQDQYVGVLSDGTNWRVVINN